jgi:hypothetical protein
VKPDAILPAITCACVTTKRRYGNNQSGTPTNADHWNCKLCFSDDDSALWLNAGAGKPFCWFLIPSFFSGRAETFFLRVRTLA